MTLILNLTLPIPLILTLTLTLTANPNHDLCTKVNGLRGFDSGFTGWTSTLRRIPSTNPSRRIPIDQSQSTNPNQIQKLLRHLTPHCNPRSDHNPKRLHRLDAARAVPQKRRRCPALTLTPTLTFRAGIYLTMTIAIIHNHTSNHNHNHNHTP